MKISVHFRPMQWAVGFSVFKLPTFTAVMVFVPMFMFLIQKRRAAP